MIRALLVGQEPAYPLNYTYVSQQPYDAVVIGSLSLGEVLCFSREEVLQALAKGMPVILYTPGLPQSPGNRALSAKLAGAIRELKNYGIRFTDGGQKRVITAQEAQNMRQAGKRPGPGAVLTPLAREILEG